MTPRVTGVARSAARWAAAVARSVDARVSALLAVVSTGLAVGFMDLWAWPPSVPMGDNGDFTLAGMIAKGIQDHGGYLVNPSLGYPFGLQLYDLPIGDDNLNLFLMRVIGWFAPNGSSVMWVFVLLTVPLVCVSAYLVMRRLGCSIWPSALVGLLYTFIQYHFRGEVFLLLIGYWVLPFGLLLAIRVFQGVPLFARREGVRGWRAWLSRRSAATVVTCLAMGSTGLYLAGFAVVVLIAAGIAQLVSRPGRRAGVTAFAGVALIVATIVVNTSPSIVYRMRHGANPEIATRAAQESEIYGLAVTRMFLPSPYHRFEPARRLGRRYQRTTALPLAGEESSYIGVVGGAGLLGLFLFGLRGLTGGERPSRRRRYGPLAAGAAAAFVWGIVGGVNTVFSYLVLPVFRGTGRISVAIAFLGLAAAGLALDGAGRRMERRGTPVWAFPAVVVLVLAIGLYDQTGSPYTADYYRAVEAEWNAMGRFVDRAEASVPRGTPVYTLPEQQFPESPGPGKLLDYDSALGYLHAKHLRWSYGVARGRQGRWLLGMAPLPLEAKLPRVSACGFGAIWLDRAGYPDPEAAAVSARLRTLTGSAPIVHEAGRWEFFPMTSYNAKLDRTRTPEQRARLCDEVLRPGRTDIP